ncbi:hypothetical protein [Streptomyces sp. C]|uniref:hypothetical protein n=1 Tax=Streptomyces sp. C TaxID=253839 RepID=UPI00101B54F9|nr:hypothetical protein [Streptomyces sp. C]
MNEAQHYLLSEQHGEAIAAGLRELLADTSRGPVLILGLIWPGPDYFDKLTHQPTAGAPDSFSQGGGEAATSPPLRPTPSLRRAVSRNASERCRAARASLITIRWWPGGEQDQRWTRVCTGRLHPGQKATPFPPRPGSLG